MKKIILYIFLIVPSIAWSQSDRKLIREGYRSYMNEEYDEAEIDFLKAEEVAKEDFIARYNTSATMYQLEKLEESGERFAELLGETDDPMQQAGILHNIGNVLLEGQQYQQAVEAYKKSLRLNPSDEDTRYNLAYALEKLREQQQQQQEQNDDQQNKEDQQQKEQDQEQQQQDQQQEDQEQQQQDQQQEDQEQQQQDQQPEQSEENKENQQQQVQKQELSKEEAERLLNAILQKEKDVKEKVDKKKAAAAKVRTDKDW